MNTKNRIIYFALLALIIILSIFVRFRGLTDLGLAFEEPIHIYAAKGIIENGEPLMPSGREYRRALLFTHTVALSFKLFGENVAAARLPSVIFNIFSIILIYFAGSHFFDRKTGLIAALLMAFIPFEIVWARTCRMYSMYQFFYLFSVFAFYKGFEGKTAEKLTSGSEKIPEDASSVSILSRLDLDWKWLLFSGILFLVTIHFQRLALSFGLSIIIFVFVMVCLTIWDKGLRQSLKTKYFLFLLVVAIAGILALLATDVFNMLKKSIGFSPQWTKGQTTSIFRYYNFLVSPTLFAVTVFFFLGTIQLLGRFSKSALFLIIVIIVPLIFHSFFAKAQQYRYIYDIFPIILLISGYGIGKFCQNELKGFYNVLIEKGIGNRMIRGVGQVAVILVFCVLFYPMLSIGINISKIQAKEYGGGYHVRWEEGCRYVREHMRPEDILIASIPLAAEFSGCDPITYNLDNGEIDQFEKINGRRFYLHPFSDTEAIVNFEEFKTVLSENPRGWLLLDTQRFNSRTTFPSHVRKFISTNLTQEFTASDETLYVFSWDEATILKLRKAKLM